MRGKRVVRLAVAAALYFTGSAGVAHSQDAQLPFDPVLQNGNTPLVGSRVVDNGDGSFQVSGFQEGGPAGSPPTWALAWDLALDQDPFISGSITMTNLTGTTRNYNLTFSLPILPAFSPSEYMGSIDALLFDRNGDGSAALGPNANSTSIYRGTIDGVTVLPLMELTMSCSSGSPGCTASGSDSLGGLGSMIMGPAVNSTIGIFLNFSLSAGDRVTFNTQFTVEPPSTVPVPAALPLLLGGLGALALRSRRKRRPV